MYHRQRYQPIVGRIIIIGIFLCFAVLNTFIYLQAEHDDRKSALAVIIVGSLWTTVLLAAIWCRQDWARYVLAGTLFLGVVISAATFPELLQHDTEIPPVLPIGILVNFIIMLLIAFLPPIRDLTKRRH